MKQRQNHSKIRTLDHFAICEFIEQFDGSDRIDAVSHAFMASLKAQLTARGRQSFGLSSNQKDWIQVIHEQALAVQLVD